MKPSAGRPLVFRGEGIAGNLALTVEEAGAVELYPTLTSLTSAVLFSSLVMAVQPSRVSTVGAADPAAAGPLRAVVQLAGGCAPACVARDRRLDPRHRRRGCGDPPVARPLLLDQARTRALRGEEARAAGGRGVVAARLGDARRQHDRTGHRGADQQQADRDRDPAPAGGELAQEMGGEPSSPGMGS